MAYDSTQLRLLSERLVAEGMNIWSYDDTVDPGIVAGPGYISDAQKHNRGRGAGRGVLVGDIIHYRYWVSLTLKTNLLAKVEFSVTAVTETGATLVPMGGILLTTSTARLASSAATTNPTNVKASPGTIGSIQGINTAAYAVFLVLYDSVANPPVPGTTVIREKIPLPAGAAFAIDAGWSFTTGIGYALTKLAADSDTTVIAAGDIQGLNINYI